MCQRVILPNALFTSGSNLLLVYSWFSSNACYHGACVFITSVFTSSIDFVMKLQSHLRDASLYEWDP